jgi:hypothetical protein
MLIPPNAPTSSATSLGQSVAEAPGTAPHSTAPKRAKLPPELAAAAHRDARRVGRKFQRLFLGDPRLKERYAAAIRKDLPPRPRPPGQPAQQQITEAEKLLRRVRREHPEEDRSQHLERVCAALFPDWQRRPPQARRQDKRVLANQIRSRRNARSQRLERRRAVKQSQAK